MVEETEGWERHTIVLSADLDTKLRKIQGELISTEKGQWSLSTIVNGILELGLKNSNRDVRDAILKHKEKREY